MAYPRWTLLIRPYAHLELPGWGRVLRAAGVFRDEAWKSAPRRIARGKLHGYQMELDLSDDIERQAYFLGRHYELETQLFMMHALRPGDTFVDVGANAGLLTLLGARCVGPAGAVHAVEPNPIVFAELRRNIERNNLHWVTLHGVGLSEKPDRLVLKVVDHSIMGTFGAVREKDRGRILEEHRANVVPGDELLSRDLPGEIMIKLDIEGYETYVLRGLRHLIRQHRPAVITEAIDGNLRRAGASIDELFDLLHGHGYDGFNLDTRRAPLRHRLRLHLVQRPADSRTDNIAWLHPDGPHRRRLAPDIAGS